jgi:hypothetical protein
VILTGCKGVCRELPGPLVCCVVVVWLGDSEFSAVSADGHGGWKGGAKLIQFESNYPQ